jgi:hypothetical protein
MRAWIAGSFWAVVLCTSVGVAIAFATLTSIWMVLNSATKRVFAKWVAIIVIISILMSVVFIAPIHFYHRTAYHQILSGATAVADAGSRTMLWLWAWRVFKFHMMPVVAAMGALVLIFPVAFRYSQLARWLQVFASSGGSLLIVLLLTPGKATYILFVAPFLCAAVPAILFHFSEKGFPIAPLRIATGVCLIGLSIGVVPLFRSIVSRLACPFGQRFVENAARLRASIPPGSTVITQEYWSSFALDHHVLDPEFAGNEAIKEANYIVLPAGRVLRPEWQGTLRRDFVLVYDNRPFAIPTLFGFQILRDPPGWGAALWRRRSAIADMPFSNVASLKTVAGSNQRLSSQ